MRKLFAISVLLLIPGAVMAADGPNEQARALFNADWQWRMQQQPEYATSLGDYRFDNTLTDTSPAAVRAALARQRRVLEQARQLERDKLTAANQLSLDLFVYDKEQLLRGAALYPYDPQPLTSHQGLHIALPQLVAMMPFATEADYRNYLARLDAVALHVAGLIEQMREGMRSGWTAPKVSMQELPGMLRQLRSSAVSGQLGQPFRQIPATIDKPLRDAFASAGPAVLAAKVVPALQLLEEFVRNEYLPAARETIGAAALPGGQEYYAWIVARQTGTTLGPDDVHALGLKEVERRLALAPRVIGRTGYRGSFAAFAAFANTDQRLFYRTPELLLARYRRILLRAGQAMPLLFDTAPVPELLVKPATALPGVPLGAAWYEGAAGERPAAFVVNTARLNEHPLWGLETLALHEAVPGHHLQVARARAIAGMPAFRLHAWYPGFGEGWATYAETLGPEMGFYTEPLSAFGHLNAQLFRAARLVVDTGLHARGWSRQQAIDYLSANTANALSDNALDVDRTIAMPGQGLGYQLGALRIRSLREKAQAVLGERFDIRKFHAVLLSNGALPLSVLEQQVDQWLAGATRQSVALALVK